ncbi:fungal specific transcription factor domain-containing protein [Pyricularia oryzae Y34]|uniref:Fungal specific transcription factor domain-containing protein n=1 Tax=Pyricularia oryzae (strain Y34) TaxID=1143189 RepID=A0AA97PJU1_PYRO3|nr:fungal specific transcription factor domain-containing protein [Pyricularia oryzae Y34]
MDLLEDQVSDLRQFLRQPPRIAAGGTSVGSLLTPQAGPRVDNPADAASQSPSVSEPGGARTSNKRRPEDEESGPKQQRSKRNRRCGHLNLACLYSPNCCSSSFKESDDYKRMTEQIAKLQEQVNTLFDNMNSLRQDTLHQDSRHHHTSPSADPRNGPAVTSLLAPSVSNSTSSNTDPALQRQSLPPFPPPGFRGPTSSLYGVNVAKTSMHNMGYNNDGNDDNIAAAEEALEMSPPGMIPASLPLDPSAPKRATDPLWLYDKHEMLRLCRVHEEEIGIMYPVINIETVMEHARNLASWMEATKRKDENAALIQDVDLMDIPTLRLKIIMCCAMVVEGHGHSPKATELFETIRHILDRKLMSEPSEVANLPVLCLYAGYRFLNNEEIFAWRVVGQVTRLCLVLGLHRREGLMKIPEEDRNTAITTFWASYVLDRRWSFGTGLPFAVQDDMIDPRLPRLDEYPYLAAMISYSRLGAKIWRLVDYFEPAFVLDLKREEFEALDREIVDWYEGLPSEVKSPTRDVVPLPSSLTYNTQKLQVWTSLRLNQLAQKVVDLARETIQYLKKLNDLTNLYRRLQVFYHQFLTSAMAVLFLASAHAPVDFSSVVRSDFYTALELIKDMSAKSWVSQRLWRTVKSLKNYTTRVGLEENGSGNMVNGRQQQQHNSGNQADDLSMHGSGMSTSGMNAMTGMDDYMYSQNGGGNNVESSNYPPPPQLGQPQQVQQGGNGNSPASRGPTGAGFQYGHDNGLDNKQNGLALQSEMKNIFEGCFGINGLQMTSMSESDYAAANSGRGSSTFSSIVGIPPSEYSPVGGGGGNDGNNDGQGPSGDGLGMSDAGVYLQFKDLF